MLSEPEWAEAATELRLTPREREVLRYIFKGHTRDSTAARLGVSPRTVRKYLEQLHEKLNVTDRVGLALRVVQTRDRLAGRRD